MGEVTHELALVGYELVLFVTPTPELPDHHALAIAKGGQVQATLSDDAASALLRAMRVIDNPYQQPKS